MLILVYQRQGVELMIPDDIVCFLEGGVCRRRNELFKRRHEALNLFLGGHTRDAVVTAGYNAEQLAGCGAVVGNCDGRVTGLLLQCQNVCQGLVGLDVGVRNDKASLVRLDACYHCGFALNRLRAVDKGNTAFSCQCDCHFVIGNCLHDRRDQRDVRIQCGLLALLKLYDRRAQTYVCRYALRGGISRYQQVLAERTRGFGKIIRHNVFSFTAYC